MLDHLPAARLALQALGHVLAELAHRAAALRAAARRRVDDPLARQVLGQGTAGRPAPGAGARLGPRRRGGELGRRVLLGHRLLELGQLELELLDEPGAALGGLAVPFAPRLGEQQPEALDLQPGARHTASMLLTRASASSRAARSARIIACAAARSPGRLVVASGMGGA